MIQKKHLYLIIISIFSLFLHNQILFAVNSNEKTLIENARIAFENLKLDLAISYYDKIPQSSDFWIESLEEKAWSYLRKNDHNKALSVVTTLTSDLLAPQTGPEPYFLKALLNYKLCHIVGVMEDFQLFKSRFQSRENELSLINSKSRPSSLLKAYTILKQKKSQWGELKADDFGANIQSLPRYFYRDKKIISAIQGESETDFFNRMIELAQIDIKEIKDILQKMQILETQVVQQVFAYNKEMQKKRSTEFSNKPDKNTLVFPYTSNDEIWIDEIVSIEAATAECPIDPFKGGVKQ